MENAFRILVGKSGVKSVGKIKHRWQDNIKVGHRKRGWGFACVDLARDRDW
jgi:hypothetical protein